LAKQAAAVILGPSNNLTPDHQLVIGAINSTPHYKPGTRQDILSVNFANLIEEIKSVRQNGL
tara:strand:+ start:318 stop:503 length:186 start_codon:yes stop_codon:yes gene_type:complete